VGRSAKHEADKLAKTVSIQRLAEARGVKLRKRGQLFTGACPFHDGKLPKLSLAPKANTWTCEQGCTGSVIEWTMKAEGVSRHHAIELLRSDFEPASAAPTKAKKSTTAKLGSISNPDEPDNVLGRSLDNLPPQPRNLLHQLHGMVCDIARRDGIDAGDVRFSRREAREHLGIGDTQLRVHLARLRISGIKRCFAKRPQY